MTEVTILTTIWCQENPGAGAFAFRYEQEGRQPVAAAFGRRFTTTNRMQMMAFLAAMQHIEKTNPGRTWMEILLRSSSEILVGSILRGHEKSQAGQKNADLWARIAEITDRHHVSAEWIKTRSTLEIQVLQQQAQHASQVADLPPDTGYEALIADQDDKVNEAAITDQEGTDQEGTGQEAMIDDKGQEAMIDDKGQEAVIDAWAGTEMTEEEGEQQA